MTDTVPGQIGRVAQNEIDFRVEVLAGQARIEERLNAVIGNQVRHEADDDRRFAELRDRYVGVESSVGDVQKVKNKLSGAWFAIGIVTLVIVGAAQLILAIAGYFKP